MVITSDDFESSEHFLKWFLENKPFDKIIEFKC